MPTKTWLLADITTGRRFRRDLGDIRALADSIQNVGLLHPIVITPRGHLIAGRRRLEAVRSLKWHRVPVHVVALDDILRGQLDENTVRKDFLPSEVAAICAALRPREEQDAQERQMRGRICGGKRRHASLRESFTQAERQRVRVTDRIANYCGISGRTLEKIEVVLRAANENPQYRCYSEEMDRTRRVDGVYRRLSAALAAEALAAEPPPLPAGPFRVVVIDPPWTYHAKYAASSRAVPYPTMSFDQIASLPVPSLAASNAIVWLWTTNAHLPEAFRLIEGWDFQYKTILTWVKDRMGTGEWLRTRTEHCLLAVRGRPVFHLTNQTTVLHAPVREHSRKPDRFYQLVEEVCPGSKLELFARMPRKGWTQHGRLISRCAKPAARGLPLSA